MELSAHVWKSVAACAHEEDDMKQTKTAKMTGLRIICRARPCLNGVGHNDVGWTLLGQVKFFYNLSMQAFSMNW